jgi:hypothetical protein
VVHYDGHRWRPAPGVQVGWPVGLAALAANDIWLAGAAGLAHWDGTAWHAVALPTQGILQGISAVSASDTWLVGYSGPLVGPGRITALTEHWDGRHWTTIPSPTDDPYTNQLHAVVALASDNVWAAGEDEPGNREPLFQHWDGHAWTVVPSPNPAPDPASGYDNAIIALSALSSTDVWAVGRRSTNFDTSDPPTFLEHWDGRSWQLVPTDPRTYGGLFDVVPVAPNDAWGLGSVREHWDGARWRLLPNQFAGVATLSSARRPPCSPARRSARTTSGRWAGRTIPPARRDR